MKSFRNLNLMLILIILLVGIGLALTGCASKKAEIPVGVKNQVLIQGFKFQPQKITVKVGDTVTWVNKDSATHKIQGSGFESANMSKNDEYKFTFDKAGTYEYICGNHTYMKGTVIVK